MKCSSSFFSHYSALLHNLTFKFAPSTLSFSWWILTQKSIENLTRLSFLYCLNMWKVLHLNDSIRLITVVFVVFCFSSFSLKFTRAAQWSSCTKRPLSGSIAKNDERGRNLIHRRTLPVQNLRELFFYIIILISILTCALHRCFNFVVHSLSATEHTSHSWFTRCFQIIIPVNLKNRRTY